MDAQELANELASIHSARLAERTSFDTQWQQLAEFFCPRKANITGGSMTPDGAKEAALFDGSGYYALDVAVRGQTADIIPHDQPWFTFDPPFGLADNFRVQQWAQEATRIARLLLQGSKFYPQGNEFVADRTCFGTACFYSEEIESTESPVKFRAEPVGSFVIAEGSDGFIDSVSIERKRTARQLVQQYGLEVVSPRVREAYNAGKGKQDAQFTIVACVYPRAEADRLFGKIDGPNKPFASVTFEKDAKHPLKISGYDEMPYSVSRWSTWAGYNNESPYGYSPAWLALPDMKQLNLLQKMLDVLAEKKVNPPMMIPVGYKGDIDHRAGGVTWFEPSLNDARPQPWGNDGEYVIGVQRADAKKRAVDEFFQVNMWLAISRMERANVTAEEIRARVGEQTRQFGATYTLLVTEWLNKQLKRFFRILLKQGLLPAPPPEMIGSDGRGGLYIPEPELLFSSRIALALKEADNMSTSSILGFMGSVAQFQPDIMDNVNWDAAVRGTARNRGLPPEYNRDPDEVEAMRAARAQQQQQMLEAQQAESMSKAAKNVGSIPKDSPMMALLGQ